MSLKNDFKIFCQNIELNNLPDMETTAGEIAKKLNKHYYNLDNDTDSHLYIVGSVGRKTAIKNSSDLDIIFDLPNDVFKRFDEHETNGQSNLLQEVKNVLKERYPRTEISGDGQVVVINFSDYTVELVPGFKQESGKFKYPDTNDGGSWKITDPLSEQKECKSCDDISNEKFYDFCHIIRAWKNKIGFKFGGLLIDTLVYNCFNKNDNFKEEDDYYKILKSLWGFLKDQDKDQSFWYAVGSNQKVYNSSNGNFVAKAKKAYNKIQEAESNNDNINNVLRNLLGKDFPKNEQRQYTKERKAFNNTEEFIEDLFPVDVRYNLSIECNVSQDGWRPTLLKDLLKNGLLRKNKKLDFYIESTDCPDPYDIYWKVRNVGRVAEDKDCIRGQIRKTNNSHQYEHSDFQGEHFVECYLVKNKICVAKSRIEVPISTI